MNNEHFAPKIVNGALLGFDAQSVVVNNKVYMMFPPTIKKIAGAGYYLSDVSDGETIKDVIKTLGQAENAVKALSWFINGNEDLVEELSKGTFDEIVDGLEVALSLVSAKNFLRLSIFARNVRRLTANPRQ